MQCRAIRKRWASDSFINFLKNGVSKATFQLKINFFSITSFLLFLVALLIQLTTGVISDPKFDVYLNPKYGVGPICKLVKAQIVKNNLFSNHKVGEDARTTPKWLFEAKKVVFVSTNLYAYYFNPHVMYYGATVFDSTWELFHDNKWRNN